MAASPTRLALLSLAALALVHEAGSSSAGPLPGSRSRVRGGLCVVTDIDDTVKSSGGLMLVGIPLGGVDTSFSRGAYYPGVFQFQLELSMHGLVPGQAPALAAVLTARAREFKIFLEIKPDSPLCMRYRKCALEHEQIAAKEWCVGHVLYGSVLEWICQSRKGWRKIENFRLLREEHGASGTEPSGYVFVGDNGWAERDEEAIEGISGTGALIAAFVHAVSDTEAPPTLPSDRQTAHGTPVLYFRTFVGAAVKAFQHGLMDAAGLQRVVRQAQQDATADEKNVAPGSLNARILQDDIAGATALLNTLAVN